jgi:hypothetical protein
MSLSLYRQVAYRAIYVYSLGCFVDSISPPSPAAPVARCARARTSTGCSTASPPHSPPVTGMHTHTHLPTEVHFPPMYTSPGRSRARTTQIASGAQHRAAQHNTAALVNIARTLHQPGAQPLPRLTPSPPLPAPSRAAGRAKAVGVRVDVLGRDGVGESWPCAYSCAYPVCAYSCVYPVCAYPACRVCVRCVLGPWHDRSIGGVLSLFTELIDWCTVALSTEWISTITLSTRRSLGAVGIACQN